METRKSSQVCEWQSHRWADNGPPCGEPIYGLWSGDKLLYTYCAAMHLENLAPEGTMIKIFTKKEQGAAVDR